MEEANLNYINELSGDNPDFKAKIISIVKRELPEEISTYEKDMKSLDFFHAAQAVHKLKHKISILGLEKSYYIADEFESNLKNNTPELHVDFNIILKTMQEFVNRL